MASGDSVSQTPIAPDATEHRESSATTSDRPPTYVKLAMRNMVRKRGKSLFHFTLTAIGLLTFLVGLSYLTR